MDRCCGVIPSIFKKKIGSAALHCWFCVSLLSMHAIYIYIKISCVISMKNKRLESQLIYKTGIYVSFFAEIGRGRRVALDSHMIGNERRDF